MEGADEACQYTHIWGQEGKGETCVALSRLGVQSCILCSWLSLRRVFAVTRADGPVDMTTPGRKEQEMGVGEALCFRS